VSDFNTSLSPIGRSSRQKSQKTNFRIKWYYISNVFKGISKIDHILAHKASVCVCVCVCVCVLLLIDWTQGFMIALLPEPQPWFFCFLFVSHRETHTVLPGLASDPDPLTSISLISWVAGTRSMCNHVWFVFKIGSHYHWPRQALNHNLYKCMPPCLSFNANLNKSREFK
jgi:hypothetical protein